MSFPHRISTPCMGICRLERGLCAGCLRTLDEIAEWGQMPESRRVSIMQEVLPQRRAVWDEEKREGAG